MSALHIHLGTCSQLIRLQIILVSLFLSSLSCSLYQSWFMSTEANLVNVVHLHVVSKQRAPPTIVGVVDSGYHNIWLWVCPHKDG